MRRTDQPRLLHGIPTTPAQHESVEFLIATGDLDPHDPSPLPPSPRELSCIAPPEWINEDLTIDHQAWTQAATSSTSRVPHQDLAPFAFQRRSPAHDTITWGPHSNSRTDRPSEPAVDPDFTTGSAAMRSTSMNPVEWAKDLILLDLNAGSDGSFLDHMVSGRIKLREDLNRVMVKTLTREDACPLDRLTGLGLRLLRLDGTIVTGDAGSIGNPSYRGTLDAPTICMEDHRMIMGMISDDLKTAYSVTPVQRLRNLRNGVDWERMELDALKTLGKILNGDPVGDAVSLLEAMDVLAPVFCPAMMKGRLVVDMLLTAIPVEACL